MSKNIDNIIRESVEAQNFEYKDEYWKQMQEKLDSTPKGNGVGLAGYGTLITSVVIVSISIIIGIYLINPGGEEIASIANTKDLCNDEVLNKEIAKRNIAYIDSYKEDTKTSEQTVNIKNASTAEKKISNTESTQPESSIQSKGDNSITEVETKNSTINTHKSILENEDHEIELSIVSTPTDSKPIGKIDSVTKENTSLSNDTVSIPDAKILGDDKNLKENGSQVNVESGPKEIKNIKTKSKPVKRVFRKRKGILYWLGIRK